MAVQVYFIGAGPGDPELITIKAKNIIEKAGVIIYADSLVNPEVCLLGSKGVEIIGSASLSLEEITAIIERAVRQGKIVARLQTGDPSVYGAIREQMDVLDSMAIEYEVIPGVSSLFAAAAALKMELTVPGISQTVIVTRLEGRTPVPSEENLKSLAAHHASLAVFLSAGMADRVAVELMASYSSKTPVAIVYRASWPDQKIVHTTLENLAADIQTAGITKQALILVGRFLEPVVARQRSKLYNRDFNHEYRQI